MVSYKYLHCVNLIFKNADISHFKYQLKVMVLVRILPIIGISSPDDISYEFS